MPHTYRAPADKLQWEYNHTTRREIETGKRAEWFVRGSAMRPYAHTSTPRKLTTAQAAMSEAGQIRLYRRGVLVG
jgi:hypothetical protein